mmetsp:Transcript_24252/g.76303  ORF Transcript_24252/g.76303 Transcript_24252/m.76303 type:complete len:352 (-) Transcript_24252:13-1068(-)
MDVDVLQYLDELPPVHLVKLVPRTLDHRVQASGRVPVRREAVEELRHPCPRVFDPVRVPGVVRLEERPIEHYVPSQPLHEVVRGLPHPLLVGVPHLRQKVLPGLGRGVEVVLRNTQAAEPVQASKQDVDEFWHLRADIHRHECEREGKGGEQLHLDLALRKELGGEDEQGVLLLRAHQARHQLLHVVGLLDHLGLSGRDLRHVQRDLLVQFPPGLLERQVVQERPHQRLRPRQLLRALLLPRHRGRCHAHARGHCARLGACLRRGCDRCRLLSLGGGGGLGGVGTCLRGPAGVHQPRPAKLEVSVDPREEVLRVDRFGDIVVGPRSEPRENVLRARARGEGGGSLSCGHVA